VIIRVPDLSEELRRLDYTEKASSLNEMLAASKRSDEQRFDEDLRIRAEIHRYGTDVHLDGRIDGSVRCTCRRCLDDFEWSLRREFRFLIIKAQSGDEPEDDTGLDHYRGDEFDLGPLVREQALLALDRSALCSEACKGLCPRCGANRNREVCSCSD